MDYGVRPRVEQRKEGSRVGMALRQNSNSVIIVSVTLRLIIVFNRRLAAEH